MRGGATGNSLSYTKVGLVNLSGRKLDTPAKGEYFHTVPPRNGVENDYDDDLDYLSISIVKQWVSRQIQSSSDSSSGGDMKMGGLIAIPSGVSRTENEISFKETSFLTSSHFASDINQDVCDTAETIGCLADTIILIYDSTCVHRQKAIVRLIKGIERQRASNIKSGRDGNKHVNVLIFSADDALEELEAIRDVVSEGDDDLGDMIQIVSISGEENGDNCDDYALLEGLDNCEDILLKTYHEASLGEKDVPINSFPLLVRAIDTKFRDGGQTGKKILFDTLKIGFVEEEEEEEEGESEDEKMSAGDEMERAVDAFDEEQIEEESEEELQPDECVEYDLEPDEEEFEDFYENSEEVDEGEIVEDSQFQDVDTLESLDALEPDEEQIDINVEEYDDEEVVKDFQSQDVDIVESDEEQIEDFDEKVDGLNEEEVVADLQPEDIGPVEEHSEDLDINGEKMKVARPEEMEDIEEDSMSQELTKESTSIEKVNDKLKMAVHEKLEHFSAEIEDQLSALERKQDEVLLNEKKMPILEFGRDVGDLLKVASNVFKTRDVRNLMEGSIDKDFVESERNKLVAGVNGEIRRLFEIQLQSLREYYGRKYEAVIEKLQENEDDNILDMDEEQLKQKRIENDKVLTEEAKKVTAGFRAAAENAIPSAFRDRDLKEFGAEYNYEGALDGLIRDMLQATSELNSSMEEWESVNIGDDMAAASTTSKKRGAVKWYEKLAARVLVFGVNYLQGWLAYQGIKKAAEERDRMMPKFPLF